MMPAEEAIGFANTNVLKIYGSYYEDDQDAVIAAANAGEGIADEVRDDLRTIGYYVGDNNGRYDIVLKEAVRAFKRRYFSGDRQIEVYSLTTDFDTAIMIKRVLFTIQATQPA